MKNGAYIWTRQIPENRIRIVHYLQSTRRNFSVALFEKSKFSAIQLGNIGDCNTNLEKYIDSNGIKYRFEIHSLKFLYAMKVFEIALDRVREKYPEYDSYTVNDGYYIGERIINFPAKLDNAAAYLLRLTIEEIADNKEVEVFECCEFTEFDRYHHELGSGSPMLQFFLDGDWKDYNKSKLVNEHYQSNHNYPFNKNGFHYTWDEISNFFETLSYPELVMFNWEFVQKERTKEDDLLFEAIRNCDIGGIKSAIKNGADPNGYDIYYQTPLVAAISDLSDIHNYKKEKDPHFENGSPMEVVIKIIKVLVEHGADVNWAHPDKLTPLAEAALNADETVVRCLVGLGADAWIDCHPKDYDRELPSAWDNAYFRDDWNIDNYDATIWNALVETVPSNFKKSYPPPQDDELI